MSRKIFTADEVLTAADVNTLLMDQTVMSFAGTAARGSAIPSPVTGMTTYLEDSKALQVYDGSAYLGVGGLTHISTQTFSGVTSLSFPANSFTSNFDAYQIIFVHENSSTSNNIIFRYRASNTDDSRSLYINMDFTVFPGGSSAGGAVQSSMTLYPGPRLSGVAKILIANPNKALRTNTQIESTANFVTTPGSESSNFIVNHGFFNATTVFDSCSFIPSTGNFTGYAILYGYRK
jgi:hypothetical protein